MNLNEAKGKIENLMWEHGLHDWEFKFDRAINRRGQTLFRQKIITVSKHLVELNDWPRVKLTALHEIAHALVGPGYGHGPVWQKQCVAIGGIAAKCTDNVVETQSKKPRYTGSCNCHSRWKAHRLGKNMKSGVCPKCREHILWFDSVEKRTIQGQKPYNWNRMYV